MTGGSLARDGRSGQFAGASQRALKVFVSYSHDSLEHADRVLALADRLRADGLDAVIDQYEPSPPAGWPRWTDRLIDESDVVLMVCTETYFRRVWIERGRTRGWGSAGKAV